MVSDLPAPLVGDRHGAGGLVVVGDQHGVHVAGQPPLRAGEHPVRHRNARSADAIDARLDLDLLTEGDRRPVVELDARKDQGQAVERPIRLEHVEEVADARLLHVAEEDRVVDVLERIDVAEAHLQGRAVAIGIGHRIAILAGAGW